MQTKISPQESLQEIVEVPLFVSEASGDLMKTLWTFCNRSVIIN
jgi:hypothetical protein